MATTIDRENDILKLPEQIRKCVAFLAYKTVDDNFHFAGTCFFVVAEDTYNSFYVTARHVIDGMRKKGILEVFIRLNTKDEKSEWRVGKLEDWVHHPDQTVDVSVLYAGLETHHDHFSLGTSSFADQSTFEHHEAGPGDEMVITGLFKHHTGDSRNIPIVRVGNLAAMNEVSVSTQIGQIDAYLAEVRSIGGLSGSPAFLSLGATRRIGGQVKHAKSDMIFLLGLVHGHYDEFLTQPNQTSQDGDLSTSRINTGIAIIVPSEKILETIQHAEDQRAKEKSLLPPK